MRSSEGIASFFQVLTLALIGSMVGALKFASADVPPGHYMKSALVVHDVKTNLFWSPASTSRFTYAEANGYCASLTLEGAGWRLPSVKELMTIVDLERDSPPMIDPGGFPETPPEPFWSASKFATNPNNFAWTVSFATGAPGSLMRANPHWVRCVR